MPLFGPTMHRGPVKRSVHFTLSQILPLIHSLFLEFFLLIFGVIYIIYILYTYNTYLIPNAIRRRQNRDFKIYGPWNRPPMQWWSKRVMLRLCHSYFFRNCFNFCHITTLSRRKRISGFVHPEKFHPYGKREKFTLDNKSRHPRITHTKLPNPREESCFPVINILGPWGPFRFPLTVSNDINCCQNCQMTNFEEQSSKPCWKKIAYRSAIILSSLDVKI